MDIYAEVPIAPEDDPVRVEVRIPHTLLNTFRTVWDMPDGEDMICEKITDGVMKAIAQAMTPPEQRSD
jgi:hypothetical protein